MNHQTQFILTALSVSNTQFNSKAFRSTFKISLTQAIRSSFKISLTHVVRLSIKISLTQVVRSSIKISLTQVARSSIKINLTQVVCQTINANSNMQRRIQTYLNTKKFSKIVRKMKSGVQRRPPFANIKRNKDLHWLKVSLHIALGRD